MRSRKEREGSGRQICLEQNTAGSVMFYGKNASRTDWLQARRLLSVHSTLLFCGVECLEVMKKTVCFLSMVPAGLLVGFSEDFGGWKAKRSKKNKEEAVLKT